MSSDQITEQMLKKTQIARVEFHDWCCAIELPRQLQCTELIDFETLILNHLPPDILFCEFLCGRQTTYSSDLCKALINILCIFRFGLWHSGLKYFKTTAKMGVNFTHFLLLLCGRQTTWSSDLCDSLINILCIFIIIVLSISRNLENWLQWNCLTGKHKKYVIQF